MDGFLSSQVCPTGDYLRKSHALIVTLGNAANAFLSAKLISLYATASGIYFSTEVFRQTPNKDAFLWNSITKSHFSNGLFSRSLELFCAMNSAGWLLDQFTVPIVAVACGEAGRFGQLNTTNKLFYRVGERSKERLNMMISGYGKIGLEEKCIKLFKEMKCMDIGADSNSLVSVISL
ncbi:hypothetical protein SAY86_014974 [Trapa natans]|uniref:Pentatricopeptide repeat-containing protein n=1 Tax=Trapa natans TaxID=22666 RepID=A0AAN7QGU2_TRANT|nr:hypothetical protein SAY86_014974 [Trapa natans]